MDLFFHTQDLSKYKSKSQIARVVTEGWVSESMYCPRCGNAMLQHFPNNKPVADFFCPVCKNQFELKSKTGALANKVNDGAYDTMLERITGNQCPDFFFMGYSKEDNSVHDFYTVPKHFIVPNIIERRKPLSGTAKRAGWVGCNILIHKIPRQGFIPVVCEKKIIPKEKVVKKVNRSLDLDIGSAESRGWLLDVLYCVNVIKTKQFLLSDVYAFEPYLQELHPDNHNIRAKIRQQLQLLRDRGFIEFLGRGQYRKTE